MLRPKFRFTHDEVRISFRIREYDGDKKKVLRNEGEVYVIDRFGDSVETEPSNGETFICYADVCLSPTFYGWVFGFGGDIRIVDPKSAVEEIVAMARNIQNG